MAEKEFKEMIYTAPKKNSILEIIGVICFFAPFATMFVGPILVLFCLYLNWTTRLITLLYLGWVFIDSSGESDREIKGLKILIGNLYMPFVRSYFSAKLIKTSELDPSKPYIFGVHPHGVYCLSYLSNVLYNPNFYRLFPGIKTTTCTLPINFVIPMWREFSFGVGAISSSAKAISKCVVKGVALGIVVGGAREFTFMKKGTMDLVLADRKGFVKIAIRTGASLVPILNFGENELYTQYDAPGYIKAYFKIFKMAAPSFIGRWKTIFPLQHELVTIVGAPIETIQNADPSQEEIDRLHGLYLIALRDLYEKYKDTYFTYRTKEMEFL
ncbi:diacylglycerol O-acyltransferase 1 [Globomyces sp. JEL0801]|nr:diacylglycerol O-acyltransferase 1 [Globomyces sp. JEL0801]